MQATGEGVTVKKGDKVAVKAQGTTVRGTVVSVYYWGGEDGWHMEMTDANVSGGYSSWKQRWDGGHIVELNGQPVELPKIKEEV